MSLTRSIVVAEVDIELELGEEVELVVQLQVADGTEDIADVFLLLKESDGVAWC